MKKDISVNDSISCTVLCSENSFRMYLVDSSLFVGPILFYIFVNKILLTHILQKFTLLMIYNVFRI